MLGRVRILSHSTPAFDIEPENHDFAFIINGDFSIQELLVVSDILITDYSAFIFDYSLLEKPIAFYAHDFENYAEERDFYYPYKAFVPGPIVCTSLELVHVINEKKFKVNEITEFKNRFFDYQDGKAIERIVKHILHS